MQFFRILGLLLSWFTTAAGSTEPRTQQMFQDPITKKSGQYTTRFPGSSARAKSYGLLVFFHGSGNTAGYAGIFESLEAVAKDFALVPLALQVPNNALTWADPATGPSFRHVEYTRSLLERAIFSGHPEIDQNRSIFVGFSAGSTFLSGDFLPQNLVQFKGGAVLLCGGGDPLQHTPEMYKPLTADAAKGFPLYFFIQKRDFLYAQTMQGINYWKSRGALVQVETPEGGSHCAFDLNQELRRALNIILK